MSASCNISVLSQVGGERGGAEAGSMNNIQVGLLMRKPVLTRSHSIQALQLREENGWMFFF